MAKVNFISEKKTKFVWNVLWYIWFWELNCFNVLLKVKCTRELKLLFLVFTIIHKPIFRRVYKFSKKSMKAAGWGDNDAWMRWWLKLQRVHCLLLQISKPKKVLGKTVSVAIVCLTKSWQMCCLLCVCVKKNTFFQIDL